MNSEESSGEVEHDMVPRVIEDPLPDCPVCDDRADASLSGERYQLETEPACGLRTCYHGETDTIWIHVKKLATHGGQSTDDTDRGQVATTAFGRAALFAIVFGTLVFAFELGILPF